MRSLSLVVALATSLAACGAPRTAATHSTAPAGAPVAAPAPAVPEPSRAHLGSRDPVTVGSYARARDAELQFCYLEGVKSHPGLAGRLTVHVTVAGSGRVTSADIISRSWDRGRAKHVEACVLARIQRWRFEESGENEQVYPLILLFSR